MKKLIFAIIFIIGISGFILYQLPLDKNEPHTFQLPSYQLVGGLTTVEGGQRDITCTIFAKIQISGNDGGSDRGIADFLGTSAVYGSPTFTIVNPSNNLPATTFLITPQVQCATIGADIIIKSPNLTMRVYDDSKNVEFIESPRIGSANHRFNVGESRIVSLPPFLFSPDQIANQVPDRNFNSILSMEITGNLEMYYAIYPNTILTIPLEAGTLGGTWAYENIIDESVSQPRADTDGDSIFDNIDDCPTQRENYNGYQDTDGCPDSPPNVARDTDNDGIIDSRDDCPTRDEVYNGYQDTDGCPDSIPRTTPVENTNPINKANCNGRGDTWYVSSVRDSREGVCATQFDSQNNCDVYSLPLNQCINPEPPVIPPPTIRSAPVEEESPSTRSQLDDGNGFSYKIAMPIDFKLRDDSTQTIRVEDSPQKTFILDSFTLLNRNTQNPDKGVSIMEINPTLILPTSSIHSLTTVVDSDLFISGIVTYLDPQNRISTFDLPTKKVNGFRTINGGSVSDHTTGLSLGKVAYNAIEIESLVNADLIGVNEQGDIDIDFTTTGTISITVNDNGQLREFNDVDVAGVKLSLDNLKILRGVIEDDSITNENFVRCDDDEILKLGSNGEIVCIPAPKDNSFVPLCTLGVDSCEICIDDASGAGGFPCTADYRLDYCGNTNMCSSEGQGSFGLSYDEDELGLKKGDVVVGDINGDGVVDSKDVELIDEENCNELGGVFLTGNTENLCITEPEPEESDIDGCISNQDRLCNPPRIDSIGVTGILSCEDDATLTQCIQNSTNNFEDQLKSSFGLDYLTIGIIFVFIVILIAIISLTRRNRYP